MARVPGRACVHHGGDDREHAGGGAFGVHRVSADGAERVRQHRAEQERSHQGLGSVHVMLDDHGMSGANIVETFTEAPVGWRAVHVMCTGPCPRRNVPPSLRSMAGRAN